MFPDRQEITKIIEDLFTNGLLEEFIVRYNPEKWIFYKEWLFGTEDVEHPNLFHKGKSRFALTLGSVCYLATDPQKVDFELGNENSKDNKYVNFSEQLLPKILGQVPLGRWPDFSKLKLNSNIKLFDLSTDQKINTLDSMINQRLQKQAEFNFIKGLIEGSKEAYKASVDLSEAIKHCGFDGILYKSRMQTDALGSFNDPMLVVYEPSDGRELFRDVVLAGSSSK